jgi:hypothetical protein
VFTVVRTSELVSIEASVRRQVSVSRWSRKCRAPAYAYRLWRRKWRTRSRCVRWRSITGQRRLETSRLGHRKVRLPNPRISSWASQCPASTCIGQMVLLGKGPSLVTTFRAREQVQMHSGGGYSSLSLYCPHLYECILSVSEVKFHNASRCFPLAQSYNHGLCSQMTKRNINCKFYPLKQNVQSSETS